MILAKRTAVALGLGLTMIGGALAAPGAKHDGIWSVQLATDSGTCDSSASYSIAVENGSVRYIPSPGSSPATVSGRIGPDGTVDLDIRRSIAKADASGRLNGKSGSGTWQLAMLGCSGRWTAQKRPA
ncbi:hypothetical protein [Microvirga sp. G4-2]|uniref:hypothetical protein n=1 Tax=Microvirga sp. G4-2 TaxID=3434467 RepID=UPI0040439E76